MANKHRKKKITPISASQEVRDKVRYIWAVAFDCETWDQFLEEWADYTIEKLKADGYID